MNHLSRLLATSYRLFMVKSVEQPTFISRKSAWNSRDKTRALSGCIFRFGLTICAATKWLRTGHLRWSSSNNWPIRPEKPVNRFRPDTDRSRDADECVEKNDTISCRPTANLVTESAFFEKKISLKKSHDRFSPYPDTYRDTYEWSEWAIYDLP
jgi:hypothetical protein